MVNKLSSKKLSWSLGIMFGVLHAVGVLLMQAGMITYWSWAHFISVNYTLAPFNIITFIAGTVVAGILGAIIGALFAFIYNKV